jgi:SAM-dependent methyltransferase
MAFDVPSAAYQRFMGEFSDVLAGPFTDYAGVAPGSAMRVLDVGCGPGALTAELVSRLSASHIAAVDPSVPFVAAARKRLPEIDVREGAAENLPFESDTFDAAMAQLVVLFMKDQAAGLSEMARVTRPGGVVAVSSWDHASGRGPLTKFWTAVRELWPQDRDVDERGMPAEALANLLAGAGLRDIEVTDLTAIRRYETFEEWWEPHTLGVGPVGDYYCALDEDQRAALRAKAAETTPEIPFTVEAVATAARGIR